MMTAKEIRDALESRYLDVTDSEFNIAQSGFAHEHPLIAIGVVLISSIVLGTTDPEELAGFTRYSKRFVCCVAANMENSGLWKHNKYDFLDWHCGELMPPPENRMFWDHVLIGEGSLRKSEAHSQLTRDSGLIFWRDTLV